MSQQPILKVTNIRKTFGGLVALNDVSMDIESGKMTMLIGPNGSGKTTLINVISGFYKPDSGRVVYSDKDITGMAPNKISTHGLVRTFQVPAPFTKLSVMENLLIAGEGNPGESFIKAPIKPLWYKKEKEIYDRAEEVLKLIKLKMPDQMAGNLSGGQLKLLEVGRVLMTGAKMLMMDEPASGLNPTVAHGIFESLSEIKQRLGLTFLIIEHRLDIALRYVDYVYAMAQGAVISHGTGDKVMNDPKVIEGYLGVPCP